MIKEALLHELKDLMTLIIEKFGNELEQSVDIKEIVRERIESFSSEKLEQILNSIMKKEFQFIELIGGVLGFLIGTIQFLLIRLDLFS